MRAPRGGGRGGRGGGGLGFGGAALAGFTGNMMTLGVYAGVNAIQSGVTAFVNSGKEAETQLLMMANTISTLGGVDFDAAKVMGKGAVKDLIDVANTLPGSTRDFISIAQQTLDEAAIGFGSMDAALADISKGADSFVGRFGLLAQAAGLDSAVAAGDLAQLAANPMANARTISLFKYNPALFKEYREELIRNGGDYFAALNTAMSSVVSPELINELRGTLSTGLEEFQTKLFGEYGIFGAMRELTMTMPNGMQKTLTTMDSLGLVMRSINDVLNTILGMGLSTDPLVSLNLFLYDLERFFSGLNNILKGVMSGAQSWADLFKGIGTDVGRFLGELGAKLINFVASVDYSALLQGVQSAITAFFTTLFSSIDYGQIGSLVMNLIASMFTSIPGLVIGVVVIAKFVAAIKAALVAFTAFKASMAGIGIVLKVAATGLVSTISAVIAPVLAVVGAVLLVIAIVRNFGDILEVVGGGLQWLWANIKMGWLTLVGGLLKGVRKILGPLGRFLDGPLKAINSQIEQAGKDREKAAQRVANGASGIAEQTAEDFGRIRDAAGNLIPSFDGVSSAASQASAATAQATQPTAEAMEGLRAIAEELGSTYENNIKIVDKAGKEWGWAMKDGKKILVEWGSVAGTSLDAVSQAAVSASTTLNSIEAPNMDALVQKMLNTLPETMSPEVREEIENGRAIANTPEGEAAGRAWLAAHNAQNSVEQTAQTPAAAQTPQVAPAVEVNLPDISGEMAQVVTALSALATQFSSDIKLLGLSLYQAITKANQTPSPVYLQSVPTEGANADAVAPAITLGEVTVNPSPLPVINVPATDTPQVPVVSITPTPLPVAPVPTVEIPTVKITPDTLPTLLVISKAVAPLEKAAAGTTREVSKVNTSVTLNTTAIRSQTTTLVSAFQTFVAQMATQLSTLNTAFSSFTAESARNRNAEQGPGNVTSTVRVETPTLLAKRSLPSAEMKGLGRSVSDLVKISRKKSDPSSSLTPKDISRIQTLSDIKNSMPVFPAPRAVPEAPRQIQPQKELPKFPNFVQEPQRDQFASVQTVVVESPMATPALPAKRSLQFDISAISALKDIKNAIPAFPSPVVPEATQTISLRPQTEVPQFPNFAPEQKKEPLANSYQTIVEPSMAQSPSFVTNSPTTTHSVVDSHEVVINGGVNVTVSGEHKNPNEIADAVAEQFLASIKKATYSELDVT